MTKELARHNPSRRRFLHRLSLAAGTFAVGGSSLLARAEDGEFHEWRAQRHLIRPGRQFFPQSVASFEPRPGSVVLWARLHDGDYLGQDLELTLLVGTDPWLHKVTAATEVLARAIDDGVVQVKLTGLEPGRRYYYRFAYEKDGRWYGSALARTRTAPRANDPSPVRFALANCQDAIGRYFNPYLVVLAQDPDFVLHVGDYIYETSGAAGTPRGLQFTDLAGAIPLGTEYAAASLSNYRQLYQFYRSDPLLQRVHERVPFVNTWDDHEYADDCWQATANYFAGRRDENDPVRRRNAERAFFEYVAVDVDDELPDGQVDLAGRDLYPDGRLYRDFRYGRNLHLVLTDSRSYRPDHLIPEDAFPGTVPVDRATLTALLAGIGIPYDLVKERFAPYIDLADPAYAPLLPALVQVLTFGYLQEGLTLAEASTKAQANIQGKLDVRVVNSLLAGAGIPPIGGIELLDRGISFAHMGKTALFSSLGSRVFVAKDTFDLYAAFLGLVNPASQDVYDASRAPGRPQVEWLSGVLQASDARWKVVANATSLTSMVLDLSGQLPGLPEDVQALLTQLPPELRTRFYLSVDQMDGFPDFTRALLELYSERADVALVAGDIHGAFATRHAGNVWEFTAPAISSQSIRDVVLAAAQSDPMLSQVPVLPALIAHIEELLTAANPEIRYANTVVNGVVMLEAEHKRLRATYWELDDDEALTSYYERPLQLLGKLKTRRFEVGDATTADAGPSLVGARATSVS